MNFKSYLIEKDYSYLKNLNSVLFYGENLGLKNDLKSKIKNLSKKALIINLNQEEILANENEFFQKLFNKSLFEDTKIFFINQANDKILEIIKEIEKKENTPKIFLFSELLDKKSKLRSYFEKSKTLGIVPCYADNDISLKKIILDKLKGYTGLSNQNLNVIVENCGLDRSKLNNELNKIVTFFENKVIETNKLEILLNLKINDSFDLLKDQALIGDKTKTNKLISDTILEKEKNIFYLNVINQRLTKLLEVTEIAKDGNLDEAIDKIKPPIFWKDKAIFNLQAQKWNGNKLKKMMNETYKIELKIKSNSQITQNLLIKKLLIDMCCLANA
tara:strand:+ start:285 stop:1277 length:993 start_codon:yes stop_codon:yes gene_type:complete